MTTSLFFYLAALIIGVNAVERAPPTVPLKSADILVLRQPPNSHYINAQQQNCTLSPVDLTFVVDQSGSIGTANFKIILNFLATLSRSAIIGPGTDRSQLAMVKFASAATVVFKLNTYLTNDQVANAINQTSYSGGGTNIASGMNAATSQVYIAASGDRPTVADVMIVLTDGDDTSDVNGAWRAAHSKNISVYAIGIGSDISLGQLINVTGGDPKKVFNVTTFPGLLSIIPELCQNISSAQTPPPPPTGQCQNGGTMHCRCPFGFTGPYCEADVTLSFCGPHGTCHYDPNSGSYCVCDHGWTGPLCSYPIPDQVYISKRCQFYYESAHPNPNCTSTDRCLADDLNCHVSPTPAACRPSAWGWCLPEKNYKAILASRFSF